MHSYTHGFFFIPTHEKYADISSLTPHRCQTGVLFSEYKADVSILSAQSRGTIFFSEPRLSRVLPRTDSTRSVV